MSDDRIEVQRKIPFGPHEIFRVLCDPEGHVSIDSAGMLMSARPEIRSRLWGDTFVVHMDREALNDFPLGEYDVTVEIVEVRTGSGNRLEDPRQDPSTDRPYLRISA